MSRRDTRLVTGPRVSGALRMVALSLLLVNLLDDASGTSSTIRTAS